MRNLSLLTLVRLALKHIFLLILVAIIAATAAFSYCKFVVTPLYTASGTIYLNNGGIGQQKNEDIVKDNTVNNVDLTTSKNLVNYIMTFLNSEQEIYKQLAVNLGYEAEQYKMLKGGFGFPEPEESSMHLKVSYTSADRDQAAVILSEFFEILPKYANTYFAEELKFGTPNLDGNAVKTYPSTLSTMITFSLVATVVTYLIILIVYSSNTIIQNDDDFRERFDLPVLGCIPDFAQAKSQSYYTYYGKRGKSNVK